MDTVYKSAAAFQSLLEKEYRISISYRKKLIPFTLSFKKEDFSHIAGLQYLSDIIFDKNPTNVFDKVISREITDQALEKSTFYTSVKDNYVNVKERIMHTSLLEECLDSNNLIFRYIDVKNPYSKIKAEYLIEASVNHLRLEMFLAKRNGQPDYKVCSFFRKNVEYRSEKAYWMSKEKVDKKTNTSVLLYNKL